MRRSERAAGCTVVLALLAGLSGLGCPGGRGGAGGGGPGSGSGGSDTTDEPDVARVTAGGAALPRPSEVRPRPALRIEVEASIEVRHVVAALRRASAEGFGNFRLAVGGKDPGPVFGFEVVREEKERAFTEPGLGALGAAPGTALPPALPAGPGAPGLRPRAPADLAAALAAKVPILKGCWDKLLRRRPLPEAKVTIYVHIDPAGRVLDTRVDASTVPDAELHECLLARVRAFAFAPASEESEVLFPLVFTASGKAEFPLAVAIGARTIAVTDTRGEEHAHHAKAGDLIAEDVRRVIFEATMGPERAPRADVLPREGLRAGMLDLALRLLEEHAHELRIVSLD